MRVWVIKDGETLPIQDGTRAMRTGMLAETLLQRGHEVDWWASTFSHQYKQLLRPESTTVDVADGYRLRLLHAGTYRRNISLARYRHHGRLAQRFAEAIRQEPPPDAIVCAFPIIEVAWQAVRFARSRQIPILVDVRDLWPDFLLDCLPAVVRPSARRLLRGEYRRTHELLRGANGLLAISQGCLDWGLNHAGRNEGEWDCVFHTGYPRGDAVRPEPIPDWSDRPGDTVVSFVGSFGRSYDLQTVCLAAERLWNRGCEHVRFVVAGDGQQRPHLERFARRLPNVRLTGWLPHAQILWLLQNSHVGLVPCDSVEDAMPNKVFEYLSQGLPLVSSLQGEAQRLISAEGLGESYAVGDSEQLAKALQKLAADPTELARTSGRARRVFQQRFDASQIYSEYAAHVERLASGRADSHLPLRAA